MPTVVQSHTRRDLPYAIFKLTAPLSSANRHTATIIVASMTLPSDLPSQPTSYPDYRDPIRPGSV